MKEVYILSQALQIELSDTSLEYIYNNIKKCDSQLLSSTQLDWDNYSLTFKESCNYKLELTQCFDLCEEIVSI